MKEEFKQYAKSLTKKYSFAWKPSHQAQFHTRMSQTAFVALAIEAFEALEWEVVYGDEKSVKAIYQRPFSKAVEAIKVVYEYGQVEVTSVSEESNLWDNGRNSKWVQLFIYAFEQVEKKYDKAALADVEQALSLIHI